MDILKTIGWMLAVALWFALSVGVYCLCKTAAITTDSAEMFGVFTGLVLGVMLFVGWMRSLRK